MKKLILIFILIIAFGLTSKSQPFAALEAGNQGVGINAGVLVQSVELKAGINMPLLKSNIPTLFYASLGNQFYLGNAEENRWSITPSAGYGVYKVEDFSDYEATGTIRKVEHWAPKFGLELGKDAHIGRFYVAANWMENYFVNVGIRAYIK